MPQERRKYTIKALLEPKKKDLDNDIEWICKSLGFAGTRDKENTAVEVFKVLLFAAKKREGLTSDEIAEKIGPTRGTIVHHINKYMRSGLVVKVNNKYELRMVTLKKTLEEIELDIERTIKNINPVAESIDNQIGLKSHP